ncbi:ABC transporter ATP-binding protein [Sporosarcina sp. Te-1]|uniref:ABC transporter ATP-binding protein n=1 Tax=Sporosarcina sp. Te-1 TaxID=2818390 RepID=UPI001A9D4D1A|nr:ABC transporter ATP-binding protein [Sporosarcina sp. Te-1]QTD41853.1 ABC transporter ATP-binding protein [Sporosarcina sp. Te-1]
MIQVDNIQVGYGDKLILEDLSVTIPAGQITTIIGPNGCGKSTLLKAIARVLQVHSGAVYLDGKAIHQTASKEIAKKLAILPQTADAPAGLTVRELIMYGRFPHQSFFGKTSSQDQKMVDWALEATNLQPFAGRPIEALSGGQRQRVWIAMALAQDTDILVLDEPTTYLDMAHQLDVLELLKQLNAAKQKTIVMVLHDVNHASRFSHYLIAMRDGNIITEGKASEVMTAGHLREIFDIQPFFTQCPISGNPICLSYEKCPRRSEGTNDSIYCKKC